MKKSKRERDADVLYSNYPEEGKASLIIFFILQGKLACPAHAVIAVATCGLLS